MVTLPANKAPPEPAFLPLESTLPSVPVTPKVTQVTCFEPIRTIWKIRAATFHFSKVKITEGQIPFPFYSEKGDPAWSWLVWLVPGAGLPGSYRCGHRYDAHELPSNPR